MSVIWIKAAIECDNCGKQFKVGLDAASTIPDNWSLFELVEDSVRGAIDCEEKDKDMPLCSVQNGKMLCDDCTSLADSQHS